MKLPKLIQGEEKIFINSTNNLFDQIGSSLFLEASNSFVGKLKSETNFKTISNPKNDINLEDFQGITIETFDKKFNLNFAEWINKFNKINQVFVKDLQTHLLSYQEYYINVFNNKNLVNELAKHIYNEDKVKLVAENLEDKLAKNIKQYFDSINQFLSSFQQKIDFYYSTEFLNSEPIKPTIFNHKLKKKILKSSSKSIQFNIPIVKLLDYYLKDQFLIQFEELLKIFGNIQMKYINEYKEFITQKSIIDIQPNLEKVNNEIFSSINKELNLLVLKLFNAVIKDIGEKNVKLLTYEREENFDPKEFRKKWNKIELFPESFGHNIYIFHNFKALYCSSTIIKDLSANQIDHFSILMKEKLFNELENYLILIKEKAHQKSLKN